MIVHMDYILLDLYICEYHIIETLLICFFVIISPELFLLE